MTGRSLQRRTEVAGNPGSALPAETDEAVAGRGPTRAKSIAKRQRILDAAAKLLVARGSADFPLQEVANEVGIYAASIYYYFPSREDLINEVIITSLDRYYGRITTAIAALPADSTPLAKVREAIRVSVELSTSADDYSVAYARVIDQDPARIRDEIRRHRRDIRDMWSRLLSEAQAAGEIRPEIDLDLLRHFIAGATHWVTNWYKPGGPNAPGEIADELLDVLLNGVTPAS
ncbi:TetR/AcrR family transcriptional regulator [Mycobacterium sp. CPCC 205372]|uniref:TetR/AcrR family transcriptional regulator n=2 Tax=Mycobacterium hippophais TaxID=3016340 RepID=A0ABT4PLA6_9MYCO|nr:TetR/AcrR family transcriptional regulator [Mycobacterium hippophais]